jgi:hypothetical protein
LRIVAHAPTLLRIGRQLALSRTPRTMANGHEFSDHEFPTSEVFVDCCGVHREFGFEPLETERGYFLRATERAADQPGYAFAAHSESDPYLALGRIRQRIREGLATRYLARETRPRSFTHDVAAGHIAYEGLVVDGQRSALRSSRPSCGRMKAGVSPSRSAMATMRSSRGT